MVGIGQKTTRHRSVVGERIRSEKINLRQKLAD